MLPARAGVAQKAWHSPAADRQNDEIQIAKDTLRSIPGVVQGAKNGNWVDVVQQSRAPASDHVGNLQSRHVSLAVLQAASDGKRPGALDVLLPDLQLEMRRQLVSIVHSALLRGFLPVALDAEWLELLLVVAFRKSGDVVELQLPL